MANAALRNEVFAGNRAVGRVALAVAAGTRGSRRTHVHESGSLRARFPNAYGPALDAVIVNVAGGTTGGDRLEVDIKVGPAAKLNVTTAAAEKIYRSLGPDAEIGVKLEVGPGGALAWLPQETILFDHSRFRRAIDVDLARDASLILAEANVFGRFAMGETVTSGFFSDRWRVRIDGALVFAETMRLDGGIAERLAASAVAGGGNAVASVLKFPGDEPAVAAVRAMQQDFTGEVGVSCWNGIALVRLVAAGGAALRRDLVRVLTAFGSSLPRLWLN